MSEENETRKLVPPYVAYSTLRLFLDRLQARVPGRIDRSVMQTFSGAAQNQLINAMRYLGLIDEGGYPQEALTQLVNSEGAERQQILRNVLQAAYPFLFNGSGFDLARATPQQFEAKFRDAGATGETVRKGAAFFLNAAQEAEIPVSLYITQRKRQRSEQKSPIRQRGEPSSGKSRNQTAKQIPPSNKELPAAPEPLSWDQMMVAKFPSFDPNWPDDIKRMWFEAFRELRQVGREDRPVRDKVDGATADDGINP